MRPGDRVRFALSWFGYPRADGHQPVQAFLAARGTVTYVSPHGRVKVCWDSDGTPEPNTRRAESVEVVT